MTTPFVAREQRELLRSLCGQFEAARAEMALVSERADVKAQTPAAPQAIPAERENAMPRLSVPKVVRFKVRTNRLPMRDPHQTASGAVSGSPLVPATREQAIRLGLLPLRQFATALVAAVETPPVSGVTIVDVPAMAQAQLRQG